MLEVRQLVRRYGSLVAVDNVSFSIGDHEIVGLLGHNGAGKTTIMKMLSGFLEPDRGTIRLGGERLSDNTKACQRRIGYLPENLPVYPELSIVDYLDYAAELRGLAGTAKQYEIARAIAATELEAKASSPIGTLSRGFKQRVGVAQALLGHPELLILDEPTNGLDPTQTDHMRQLIRNLSKSASIILSTHIMQEVSAICDRALILRNGKLAVDARLDVLSHSRHLQLVTTLDEAALRVALAPHPSIEAVTPQPCVDGSSDHRYQLTLASTSEPAKDAATGRAAAADVARAVLAAGGDLIALHAATRDLESLFRDINERLAKGEAPEVHDAV